MNIKEQKNNFINNIKRFKDSVLDVVDDNVMSEIDDLLDEVANELTFNVLVIGEFARGKSSFVNSFFLENNILPTSATETTAKLTVIKHAEETKIILKYYDKEDEVIEKDFEKALKESVKVDGNKLDEIQEVEVHVNSKYLKEGVIIIDSPGLNSIEEKRMQITKDYVKKADSVLFLLSPDQPWSSSEKDFIEEKILSKEDLDKIFFIVNKWDIIDEDDAKVEIIEYIKQQLQKSLDVVKKDIGENLEIPEIIPVSSKTKENFEKLDEILWQYLSNKKVDDILQQKIQKFDKLKKKIKNYIAEKIVIYQKDKEKLNEDIKALQNELQQYKSEAEDIKKSLRKEVEIEVRSFIEDLEDNYFDEVKNRFFEKISRRHPKDEIELKKEINIDIKSAITLEQTNLNKIIKHHSNKLEEILEAQKNKIIIK